MSFLTLCSLVGLHPCWNQFINYLPQDQNAVDFKCLPGHRAEEPEALKGNTAHGRKVGK